MKASPDQRGAARDAAGLVQLQRTAGNRATVATLAGRPPTVQRWPFSKKNKVAPVVPARPTPEAVQQIQTQVQNSRAMGQAEALRARGEHDRALEVLEDYWNTGEVQVDGRAVPLVDFKPLMFTPAERRMVKNRQWDTALAVKNMFDESVRTGAVVPKPAVAPMPAAGSPGSGPAARAPATPRAAFTLENQKGAVDTILQVGNVASKAGAETALAPAAYQKAKGLATTEPGPGTKSDWSNGVLAALADTFALFGAVKTFVGDAGSKEADRTATASSGADVGAKMAATAEGVMQAIEKIEGSQITTNVMHWVPGLSVLSNALGAIKSGLALVPRALQLDSTRRGQNKVTQADRDDLKLAITRLWVKAGQQVEKETFNVARSLTNTGLALAEVVTGMGFGIPRIAMLVVSGSGIVHVLGEKIGDFVRDRQTVGAREAYLGAREAGSAEKLIRTDPASAAKSIITRAFEGDADALALLKVYGVAVAPLAPASMPDFGSRQSRPEVAARSGASPRPARSAKLSESDRPYDHAATASYDEAFTRLMVVMQESKEPPRPIKAALEGAVESLQEGTGLQARWRDAKRLADVRNEIGYKNKGAGSRGGGWSFSQLFSTAGDFKKSTEKTAQQVRSDATLSDVRKQELLARLTPEKSRQLQADQDRAVAAGSATKVTVPIDRPTLDAARRLKPAELAQIIRDGRAKLSGPNVERRWEAYVSAYMELMSRSAGADV